MLSKAQSLKITAFHTWKCKELRAAHQDQSTKVTRHPLRVPVYQHVTREAEHDRYTFSIVRNTQISKDKRWADISTSSCLLSDDLPPWTNALFDYHERVKQLVTSSSLSLERPEPHCEPEWDIGPLKTVNDITLTFIVTTCDCECSKHHRLFQTN